jgi:hypothetical protein
MALMVLRVFQQNENVINEANHEIIHVFTKDIIHQMLKNSKRIGKAKWHHNIFKMVVIDSKHHLPFIAFLNAH